MTINAQPSTEEISQQKTDIKKERERMKERNKGKEKGEENERNTHKIKI